MSEIGRQRRHAGLHIGAASTPVEQGPHREAVAQIMRPGSALRRARLETGTADQVEPGEMRVAVEQSGASRRDEECGPGRSATAPITFAGVGGERVGSAAVQWDLARAKVRRYAAANRLDRLGTLTYKGDGLHDERALRRHVGHFFKRLRYEVVGEPYPYVWVPEWHKTDHGLHVHFAVDRFIDHAAMTDVWGRGFTHIKRLGNVKQEGSLSSARHAAGYLSKYVTKAFAQHERSPGLHRYEVCPWPVKILAGGQEMSSR